MKLFHPTIRYVRKGWYRVSHNLIWSAVIAAVIAAAVIGAVDSVEKIVTKKSPPAPVERAEIRGGAWGPSRLLYRCRPSGQCIAPDHIVLDSIANDPRVGNEAYFMGAKILGGPGPMQSHLEVRSGDTVVIRALVENDAAMHTTHHRSLVAYGAHFKLVIPTNNSSELPVIGHISTANATPRRIYDTVFLHSKSRFAIEYGWGSAVLANRVRRELPLCDDVVGEGALIGARGLDGAFPPGLSNDAAVFLLIHIVAPDHTADEGSRVPS
jgi:hypothetical protein